MHKYEWLNALMVVFRRFQDHHGENRRVNESIKKRPSCLKSGPDYIAMKVC